MRPDVEATASARRVFATWYLDRDVVEATASARRVFATYLDRDVVEATVSASRVFATYLDRDVVEAGSGGHSLGQKGLPGARHSVQENTTRHTHTHLPARVANSSSGSGGSKKLYCI